MVERVGVAFNPNFHSLQKWLFVELLSCAIVTLPSGSPSPLFVITMANAQAGFRSRSAVPSLLSLGFYLFLTLCLTQSHVDTGSHSGNRSRSAVNKSIKNNFFKLYANEIQSHVGGSSSYSALSMLGSSMSTSYISKFYAGTACLICMDFLMHSCREHKHFHSVPGHAQ